MKVPAVAHSEQPQVPRAARPSPHWIADLSALVKEEVAATRDDEDKEKKQQENEAAE